MFPKGDTSGSGRRHQVFQKGDTSGSGRRHQVFQKGDTSGSGRRHQVFQKGDTSGSGRRHPVFPKGDTSVKTLAWTYSVACWQHLCQWARIWHWLSTVGNTNVAQWATPWLSVYIHCEYICEVDYLKWFYFTCCFLLYFSACIVTFQSNKTAGNTHVLLSVILSLHFCSKFTSYRPKDMRSYLPPTIRQRRTERVDRCSAAETRCVGLNFNLRTFVLGSVSQLMVRLRSQLM